MEQHHNAGEPSIAALIDIIESLKITSRAVKAGF